MGGQEEAKRGEGRLWEGGIGNICGGLTAAPPTPHLIQTTAHNKDGRWAKNGVRADCEGGDTWAVFCCSLAVFLWKKDGNWQTLNKCRWHSVLCIMWGFQTWCVYKLLKMDSNQTKQVIIGWKNSSCCTNEHGTIKKNILKTWLTHLGTRLFLYSWLRLKPMSYNSSAAQLY